MLRAAILLNFRIQTTQLSPDVAEKLSGLMRSEFSGDVVGELPLAPALLSLFFPSFASWSATFSSKALTVSSMAKIPPLPPNVTKLTQLAFESLY